MGKDTDLGGDRLSTGLFETEHNGRGIVSYADPLCSVIHSYDAGPAKPKEKDGGVDRTFLIGPGY